jgi:hypothetical protein
MVKKNPRKAKEKLAIIHAIDKMHLLYFLN